MKKFGLYPKLLITSAAIIVIVFIVFNSFLEISKPDVKFDQDIKAIGRQKKITLIFSDSNSGLSHLNVEVIQDHKGQILADKTIHQKEIHQETLPLEINATELKLHDGPATIKITAVDHSLFKNKLVLLQDVKIDTVAPQIYVMKNMTYINQGGTGFVAYNSPEPLSSTGVFVNDYFTESYPSKSDNSNQYLVYFPFPMNADKKTTTITIFARDEAGNETLTALPCVIKAKRFRTDMMNLSDNFLQQKMPEFQAMIPSLQGKTSLEVFIHVNSEMRKDNFQTIQKICKNSSPRQLWEGPFLRMSNAAPMALFGDKRIYRYHKKHVAESVHEGVDLASTARAPIEASNKGIVVFTGFLGIYGNTVIIDHGMGLFSLYAHLSSIDTSAGKKVGKGSKIGLSGLSGLAGGDHLHFSMIVGGQFVNPQEWWDPHWIKDNIS